MSYLFTIAVTALATTYILLFIQKYSKPNYPENRSIDVTAWRDFIISNINSCITTDQCFQVYELIKLFRERFKNEMPRDFFNEWVESLINRVDTKYKSLKSEEEQMSELTIDRLVN